MRLAVCTSVLLMALPALGHAQTPLPQKEIVAAEHAWFDAFTKLDADAMGRIESDGFVFIQDGRMEDKDRQIASIREAKKRSSDGGLSRKYEIEVHRIVRIVDRFLVTGTNTATSPQGTVKFAFTEVWYQQSGEWHLQHAHYSSSPRDRK